MLFRPAISFSESRRKGSVPRGGRFFVLLYARSCIKLRWVERPHV